LASATSSGSSTAGAEPEHTAAASASGDKPLRFLIADDVAPNRLLLGKAMRSMFPPSTVFEYAANGEEAVAAVVGNGFDYYGKYQ
jgi:hypothetical protein